MTGVRIKEVKTGVESLSKAERRVLELLIEGKRNKEIADMCGVSVKTTSTHKARMMVKIGVRNDVMLGMYIATNGVALEKVE